MIQVLDVDAGRGWLYWRAGIGNYRLPTAGGKGWNFMGETSTESAIQTIAAAGAA